jgi:beta-glucanase (GH16 family)
LMFADEFNGPALDAMKWNYNYPLGQTIKGQASMNPNQVSIQDGKLVLTAIAQPIPGGFGYTSGAINTSEKLNITGGYIEGCFKIPSTEGTWPTFCTLQDTWPPEIDIVEVTGVPKDGDTYQTNYYYSPRYPPFHEDIKTYHQLSEGYYRYAVEWTSSYMKFYFFDDNNNVITRQFTNTVAISQAQNMYLLLSLGVVDWEGDPPPGAVFPASFYCDWVHVWKNTDAYPSSTTWIGSDEDTWDTAAAWSDGSPQLSTQTAFFGAVNAESVLVDWENTRTVGGIVFNSDVNYTLGSGDDDGIMLASPSGPFGSSRLPFINATGDGENIINARLELYNDVEVSSPNKPLVLNGAIVGPGGLQIKSGHVTINGDVSYDGETTVDGSSLEINSFSASLHDITGTGTLTVGNGTEAANLTVDTIAVGVLTIAAGSKLTIRPIPGGPLSGAIQPVPEPSQLILIFFAAAGFLLFYQRDC